MAERPQNECRDCGDTWHPRGRDLSRNCPACGSTRVRYAGELDSDYSPPSKSSGCGTLVILGTVAAVACLACCGGLMILGAPRQKSDPKQAGPVVPPAAAKPDPPKVPEEPPPFRVGEVLTVAPVGEDYSPAAETSALLAAYLKARAEKDVATDARMARLNEAVFVKGGLSVVVLAVDGPAVQVRVQGGDHGGKSLFLPAANLSRVKR